MLGCSPIWQTLSPQLSLWLLVSCQILKKKKKIFAYMLKAEWRARKSCLWNQILGIAQNQRQLTNSSARPQIPRHILAFLFLILPGSLWPPCRHHLLCREPGTFLIDVNPDLSQVRRHRTHSGRMRWAPQDTGLWEGIPAQASTHTAGTSAMSQSCHLVRHEAVLRVEGVCARVHMNFNPCVHTTHMHNACMPHTNRLARCDN